MSTTIRSKCDGCGKHSEEANVAFEWWELSVRPPGGEWRAWHACSTKCLATVLTKLRRFALSHPGPLSGAEPARLVVTSASTADEPAAKDQQGGDGGKK
jgi:hypothetical protein